MPTEGYQSLFVSIKHQMWKSGARCCCIHPICLEKLIKSNHMIKIFSGETECFQHVMGGHMMYFILSKVSGTFMEQVVGLYFYTRTTTYLLPSICLWMALCCLTSPSTIKSAFRLPRHRFSQLVRPDDLFEVCVCVCVPVVHEALEDFWGPIFIHLSDHTDAHVSIAAQQPAHMFMVSWRMKRKWEN